MSVNYSEALEQLLGLYATWQHRPGFAGLCVNRLLTAEPYWVGRTVIPLLQVGADGIPTGTTLTNTFAPAQEGFAAFEDPPGVLVNDGEPARLRAIQWGYGPIRRNSGVVSAGYWIFSYIERNIDGRAVVMPGVWTSWLVGETYGAGRRREDESKADNMTRCDLQTCETITRLWASLCLFVDQRILIHSGHRAERHVRKRLERGGWNHEPLIRVVELRRRESVDSKVAVQSIDYGWSCQWIVRGHWRQQPYPKTSTVRPKWITPYVKGPEDKPLKPPRAIVFAVVR